MAYKHQTPTQSSSIEICFLMQVLFSVSVVVVVVVRFDLVVTQEEMFFLRKKFSPIFRTCISAITWKRCWKIVRLSHTFWVVSKIVNARWTSSSFIYKSLSLVIRHTRKTRLERSGFLHVCRILWWEALLSTTSSQNDFGFHLTHRERELCVNENSS